MGIDQLKYRTKTYLAGDWSGDIDAIEKIHTWNESDKYSLHFKDVHDYTSSYDTSNYCSIKKSLKKRMDVSKMFVLVVGEHTASITKGACFNCCFYQKFITLPPKCKLGYSINNSSYIDYECELAVKAGIDIVVLYNDTKVDRSKCPLAVRYRGKHIPMARIEEDGECYWDYKSVKAAIIE